jgi:hypothetical protein
MAVAIRSRWDDIMKGWQICPNFQWNPTALSSGGVNIGTHLPGYIVLSPKNCNNVYELRLSWQYSFRAILNYGKTLQRWVKNWHRFLPPLPRLCPRYSPFVTVYRQCSTIGWSRWPTFTPTTLIDSFTDTTAVANAVTKSSILKLSSS